MTVPLPDSDADRYADLAVALHSRGEGQDALIAAVISIAISLREGK